MICMSLANALGKSGNERDDFIGHALSGVHGLQNEFLASPLADLHAHLSIFSLS